MGIEVMGKWECSVGMGIGGNGNGNDSMKVEREWEQEIHSRTPLIQRRHLPEKPRMWTVVATATSADI